MTNDYKDKLLKYLTGNLKKGYKSDNPYPSETSSKVVNKSEVASQVLDNAKVLCKDTKGNHNGKYLLWTWTKIYLYDETNTLLHTYTGYSSGVNFDSLQVLNVDEEGNIYGVEQVYNGVSRVMRFIMLNNLSEKTKSGEYQCIIRQSYFFQTSMSGIQTCYSVNKSPQSASYLMTVDGTNGKGVIQLKINVGAANEWTDFNPISVSGNITTYNYYDVNDNPVINIFVASYTSSYLRIQKVVNSGTTLSISSTTDYTNILGTDPTKIDLAIKSTSQFHLYIILNEEKYVSPTTTYRIQFLEWNNTNVSQRKVINGTFPYEDVLITPSSKFKIDVVNNIPFVLYSIDSQETYNKHTCYYGTFPGIADYDYVFEIEDVNHPNVFSVTNLYNLYFITTTYHPYNNGNIDYDHFTVETTKIIYNSNNYNGEEYENNNSLFPQQGVLYDSQNNLIFARNLYNYKNVSNYSYSVLNVPNSLLNEISLAKQDLLGQTNSTLIDSVEPITKNIYEDLYINFNNQITMSNQNETNHIDNISGAIRLNQSSGKVLDYDNAKATKIRVTYDDDTYYITGANCTIDNNVGTYSIGIHVPNDKNVQSIQIISHDENTIYQTITNLIALESNKYYVISQDVHIE